MPSPHLYLDPFYTGFNEEFPCDGGCDNYLYPVVKAEVTQYLNRMKLN